MRSSRIRVVRIPILLGILLVPTLPAIISQTRAQPVASANVRLPDISYLQREATIAVNPTDPKNLAAGSIVNGPRNYAYRSKDGGKNWDNSALPVIGGLSSDAQADPVVCFDGSGNAYYAGLQALSVVFVAKSTDGGLTYNAPSTVELNGSNDKPWIACDQRTSGQGGGNIYVAWQKGLGSGGYATFFSRSTDGGKSFSTSISVSDASYKQARPSAQVAVGPNGRVYVSWIEWDGTTFAKNAAQILVANSTDFGMTFGANLPVQSFYPPGKVTGLNQPGVDSISMDVDRSMGAVSIAYTYDTTLAGSLLDIGYTTSNDGGKTWSSSITVNDIVKNDQFMPALSVDPTGRINISWYDRRNSANNTIIDVYFTESTDGGKSFLKNVKVSDIPFNPFNQKIGDYQGIATSSSVAYPIWTNMTTFNSSADYNLDIVMDLVQQPASGGGVGGAVLPIDKLSLLLPYLAIATGIVAIGAIYVMWVVRPRKPLKVHFRDSSSVQ